MTPSRTRYKVLAFGVALAAITYMDRIAISITSKQVSRDLGLTDQQMGFVFSAFTLAYGLFEIPTGWWGDKVGTRSVLMRIVTWWSAFTMLTAAAWSFGSLLVIRFLFGIGEAGAWPNSAKTFSRWFPKTERGRAQGIFFMGAHGGGAYSPLLIAWLLTFMEWRTVFLVLGSVGFVWALLWYRWFRSEPADHPEVNAAELALILEGREEQAGHGNVPWLNILKDPNVMLLCVMYFIQSYAFYFYLTWMPTYLERIRGFKATDLGLFAGAPMVACMVADLTGGLATDSITKRFGLRLGRTIAGGSGFIFAGLFTLLGASAADPTTAALYLALGAGWGAFCLGAAWGTCMDIAGPHAGVVGAVMNTAGQVGGFLSPIVLATLIRETGDWNTPLNITGVMLVGAALCWVFINPNRRIRLH
ncbi:MAG: MFS transporter [Acidobacteriota bacterium]|jgi:MFS family permease|nr:MFS transporter [Acidobacteriaceae bacterium]